MDRIHVAKEWGPLVGFYEYVNEYSYFIKGRGFFG
jgi:hypothetical protein